jgi:hypothetical protein
MRSILSIAALTLATAALLSACYLFNSKEPGPPPENVFHGNLLYSLDEARLETLHLWVFPTETILADGYRINTSGHLRTLFIPNRQP